MPSILLDLPAELRNEVYKYVFFDHDSSQSIRQPETIVKALHTKFALVCVNKQVHNECRTLYIKHSQLTMYLSESDEYLRAMNKAPGLPFNVVVQMYRVPPTNMTFSLNVTSLVKAVQGDVSRIRFASHLNHDLRVMRSFAKLMGETWLPTSRYSPWQLYFRRAVKAIEVFPYGRDSNNNVATTFQSFIHIQIKKSYQLYWMDWLMPTFNGDMGLEDDYLSYKRVSDKVLVKEWRETVGLPGDWDNVYVGVMESGA
ncbi:hypothetical protein J1614_003882 [Plenodomus biglobosus]|nr:hypothetical protein J1614_003882 [Plenodomus biglobosus]